MNGEGENKNVIVLALKVFFLFFMQECIFGFALLVYLFGNSECAFFCLGAAVYFKLVQLCYATKEPVEVRIGLIDKQKIENVMKE